MKNLAHLKRGARVQLPSGSTAFVKGMGASTVALTYERSAIGRPVGDELVVSREWFIKYAVGV